MVGPCLNEIHVKTKKYILEVNLNIYIYIYIYINLIVIEKNIEFN